MFLLNRSLNRGKPFFSASCTLCTLDSLLHIVQTTEYIFFITGSVYLPTQLERKLQLYW